MRVVNVISSTTIKRNAALHADAAEELFRWNKAASHVVWRDVNEVRLHFPDTD
jgi:mRNA-degrading endonuclease HigB of HigAB toxin-antitoxin module